MSNSNYSRSINSSFTSKKISKMLLTTTCRKQINNRSKWRNLGIEKTREWRQAEKKSYGCSTRGYGSWTLSEISKPLVC
ncbi:OLC1v1006876C4 [Oldenlandia corymbosa var. corymbosa]|uniref:OLC1v1006876C4 n=1 Tax=Oldenlandia corymbosa var. corymbosa TaxID=529605 RepID=A0AAV1DI16_OLDCO|nr:OLC1v1006876C4 [Oldenlandia corymbosa var. corymbosa]